MTAARNAAALEAYGARHDVTYLTDDAVFTDMNSGRRSTGPAEIGEMLHWFYSVAFDAHFEQTSAVVGDGNCTTIPVSLVCPSSGSQSKLPASSRQVHFFLIGLLTCFFSSCSTCTLSNCFPSHVTLPTTRFLYGS